MSNDTPTTKGDDRDARDRDAEERELLELRNEFGAQLRSEVPIETPEFWQDVDARLASVPTNSAAPHASSQQIGFDVTTSEHHPASVNNGRRRIAGWPLAVAAAVLAIAAVIAGTQLLPSDGETVDAGFADDSGVVVLADLPGPVMFDHWHAVYGVWDCTAEDGAGGWLAPFESTRDDSGIHSHQDGLIHIHPFYDLSQGKNARLGVWANEMGITIADDALTLDDGRVLQEEGTSCGGEPAVLHLRRWTLDLQLAADPLTLPTVVTTGLADERFYNDREVWTLAFAPLDADIPLPPQGRFDTMIQHVSVFDSSTLPAVISPGIVLTPRDLSSESDADAGAPPVLLPTPFPPVADEPN